MFKKTLILMTTISILTVGCTSTHSPNVIATTKTSSATNAHNRMVVVDPKLNNKPTESSPHTVPMVKLTPATRVPVSDDNAILSCVNLVKPRTVRPTTIKPDLAKTEIERGDDGSILVKMPFTVTNNLDEPALILAACWFDEAGKGELELADM